MLKNILYITVLKEPVTLASKYHSSFNETYIGEKSYLTQKMVAGVVSAQCIADCVHRRTCVAAEWRQSDVFYCRRLYSDRAVDISTVIEPDDQSTVTYNPKFSFEGNIVLMHIYLTLN